jgi:uncharacterized protein
MSKLLSLITVLALTFSTATLVGCATSGDGEDVAAHEDEAASVGKLAFWQATDGQWHFNLKSGNGRVLLTSEAYTSRTGAIGGALSMLENGVDEAMYKIVPATNGFVLHLVAGNNRVISFSEVYATKGSATRAISSCIRAVTTYLDARMGQLTGARIEVMQGESGKFRFNVFARNGQVVMTSEAYASEASAFNGAFAVQAECGNMDRYDIVENANGGYYFTLSAQNGEVIGVSQMYTTKSAAMTGISAVQDLLPSLTVL